MKKINLNLKKKFTPKQIRILTAVAGCLCIVLVIGIIWLCREKMDIFTPSRYGLEEVEPEIRLSVEDDKAGDKIYKEPVTVYETRTNVRVGKE